MPSKHGRKEFPIFEDEEGQYILVTQPDASLKKLYIYSNVPNAAQNQENGGLSSTKLNRDEESKARYKETVTSEENTEVEDVANNEHENVDINHIETPQYNLKVHHEEPNNETHLNHKYEKLEQEKTPRVKIFTEKLKWDVKSKISTRNENYNPEKKTTQKNILDRKKLAPVTRWKASAKVDTFNKDYQPLGCPAHLIEDGPKWAQASKITPEFVRQRVINSPNESRPKDERLKYHARAKHLPQPLIQGDGNEQDLGSKWQVLPKIYSPENRGSQGKEVHYHRLKNKAQSVEDIHNPESELWIPTIDTIEYNPRHKEWVVHGHIDNENSPDSEQNSSRLKRNPPRKFNDPQVLKRIRNFKQQSNSKKPLPDIANRSKSVTSQAGSHYEPAKSLILGKNSDYHGANKVFWNVSNGDDEHEEFPELSTMLDREFQAPNRDVNPSVMSMPANITSQKQHDQEKNHDKTTSVENLENNDPILQIENGLPQQTNEHQNNENTSMQSNEDCEPNNVNNHQEHDYEMDIRGSQHLGSDEVSFHDGNSHEHQDSQEHNSDPGRDNTQTSENLHNNEPQLSWLY